MMHHRLLRITPIVALVLLTHLFLPLSFILGFDRAPQQNWLAWALEFYKAASYGLFIFLVGAWSWFGRVTRYALPAALILVAVHSRPVEGAAADLLAFMGVESLISFCIGTLFTFVAVRALRGRNLRETSVDLHFPLRGGTFVVAQGGASSLLNAHFSNASQRYALDVLELNTFGVRTRGLYPAELNRYAIFGADVLSPCDGIVAGVQDGFADLSPPDRDREHRAGNYVAIESDEATIYLAHLRQGTICVQVGEQVVAGQKLGCVGNSGNTTEPHLHVHAEKGRYPGKFSGSPGVPIRFSGRFLVRNNRVKLP
jgi:hypothetical protein